ncbi:MurR/RpiR family transcriptional regulator [Pontibacillus litoralis]|uniref:Transcriptional regulator n=1 Tax=Pontibacillus litoralis JSM 072002 TaxID=1385512 RepID=A0A0A5G5I2_9BACI|nr:MurR/RpiR family transcriptional regulator [Pontibacillus litoralis]KGX86350.1 hypothetical protein N784_05210 [Pontibacillus litoralis JSM 072002]
MRKSYIQLTEEKFAQLTKGLKKVAECLLADPKIFAIHPVKKVGEYIGVSEATVIRFCNEIGYSGYRALQQEVHHHLLNSYQAPELNTQSPYEHSMQTDLLLLQNTISQLDGALLQQFADTILSKEKVLIVGYYHSFTLAHWLYFNLNLTIGNAELYRPEVDTGLLNHLSDKGCVLVISFYRYAMETIRIAQEAKKKGITVLGITDSKVSPIVEHSDIVLPIQTGRENIFTKGPVTLSVINAILQEIIHHSKFSTINETYKFFVKGGSQG